MKGYYEQKLSAERLKRCYQMELPAVQRYFKSELDHVMSKITPGHKVLDLGCGFGRIMPQLAQKAGLVVGIDSSFPSLTLAQEAVGNIPNCRLAAMNAVRMGFHNNTFDVVACIQNGISAFHVDQKELLTESLRITKPGGTVLFSSYSEKFWQHRLEWFQMQADEGLLGEIDYEKTGNGVIVCKDGFTATTVSPSQFSDLAKKLNANAKVTEVDASSVFCQLVAL